MAKVDPKEALGARVVEGGVAFTVWAPRPNRVELNLLGGARQGLHPLRPLQDGYLATLVEGAAAGDRYWFRLDGVDRPDPCSRFQPEGVHGPSEVVDPGAFAWRSQGFRAPPLRDLVIYELHVGTFTAEGTFDAALRELPALRDLGVTAVELMPVAQFPGERDWGYDGVDLFAAQASYGGPDGLRRFVDGAHAHGLAVIQDVVLNHLGPEGNYLSDFGPYFAEGTHTPWGPALDLDGPGAGPVREHLLQSALAWLVEAGIDGLRLDAVHALEDRSARHLLAELSERTAKLREQSGRPLYLIAESDDNDVRLVQPRAQGGYGLDAVWADDFHHAFHALLTGERGRYYQDFGETAHLAAALAQGFVYEGQWSRYRGGPHGTFARGVSTDRFVVCTQNHDQIGNRARGERLSVLVAPEAERLAAVVLLTAPGLPLLFMGQEYGERRPFLYFTGYGDAALARAVSQGRAAEQGFGPGGVPDPQAPETFLASKLDRSVLSQPHHRGLLRLHHDLLELRRRLPALQTTERSLIDAEGDERRRTVRLLRGQPGERLLGIFSFAPEATLWEGFVPEGLGWEPLLDAADARYGGAGASPARLRGGFEEVSLPPFGARLYREQRPS
ncbi:MAG TPA: malto-oligosyltrehalose trehalohydrolase [Myxococcales bacterium]|nr:malto-oligosyltrehalose trehalohydrolase [Myxococcales bacterium]